MKEQATVEAHRTPGIGSDGTAELLEEGLAEAKELVRLEVSLAREEGLTELRGLKDAAIAFGAAAVLGLAATAALLAALVVATSWVVGLVVGAALLIAAVGCGVWGRSKIPTRPMEATKDRIAHDASSVRRRLS
jgi:hypothetical protein